MVLDEADGNPTLRTQSARLGRATFVLIMMAVLLVGVAVALLLSTDAKTVSEAARMPLNLELTRPAFAVVLAAGAVVTAVFVGLAGLETAAAMRALSRDRHYPRPLPKQLRRLRRLALAPTPLTAADIEAPADWPTALPSLGDLPPGTRLTCTVLIPAHNEEAVLGYTLDSLAQQQRVPDRIVVIADNCTDRTAELARARGIEVVETVGNHEKKAGALNQQLAALLPDTSVRDVVLIMDADSTISPDFLAVALEHLENDPDLIAVGGLFYGDEGGGMLGQFQRNEFSRYQRVVARKLDRVFVLTGTAAVIRAYALRTVSQARGPLIPGTSGQVYDTLALTEDNELTLALKSLGAKLTSPPQCHVTTEIMPTWRALWRQRSRWHRGALENIGAYGLTRATAVYWAQQIGLSYGVLALFSFLLLTVITLLAADDIRWSPFWLGIGAIFLAERVVTVWRAGWRGRVLAAPVFLELGYAVFLQVTFVYSIGEILVGRKPDWNYVPRPAGNVVVPLAALSMLPSGILLPATVLSTGWYEGLAIWVGFNTLVFATLSLLHLLPPLRRRRP